MTNTLAVTVGGSCAPIVTAIRDYTPTFVCFFATGGPRGSRRTVDGPGKPCSRALDGEPSIVSQLGLTADQYQIVELDDPDDPASIYATCRHSLRDLAAEYPQTRLIADYTGGSKSMGIGLALAALETGWQLSLVRGMRTDLIQVTDGTEMARLVDTWEVRVRQRMEEARRLFNDYAYASACDLLQSLARQRPLPPQLDCTVHTWVTYCRGFDAWDRFDHARAVQILSTVSGEGIPWRFLKTLTGELRATGYEPVLDLILNADRRALQGRFDDAVARLYRAIELMAQTRLAQREPPLDSSDLDLERLPRAIQAKYVQMREINKLADGEPTVRLGLVRDYELLQELEDPLGKVYVSLKDRLCHAISKRNQSILAHGTNPLTQSDYQLMQEVTNTLWISGLAALNIRLDAPQFPILMHHGLSPRMDRS